MFLLDWYNEFLAIRRENERIRQDLIRNNVCESCEYLKIQVEKLQNQNKELIDKLTEEPKPPAIPEQVKVDIKPRHIPWNVRRQMLESEDRRAAAVLKQVQSDIAKVNITPQGVVVTETQVAPPDDPDVIALEREMDIVAKEREDASTIR